MTVDLPAYEMLGGEMLAWSDLDAAHGPAPAGGAALRPLLAAVTGRALVAGPHDPALIDEVPAEQITVLVRGAGDAEALAARFADRPGVTVCCGSLEKLAAVPAYDTVVALDGLDRLCSAEAAQASRDETLARLLAVLRPPGRLLLAVANPFGLHRLVALPPEAADTDWAVAGDPDPARLRARLAEAGLPVVREYAVYPAPDNPAVLLGAEVLADPALRGYLEATLAAAARPNRRTLADPTRLANGALRHGLATALAPAWILQAGGGDPGPAALIAGRGDGSPEVEAVRRDTAGRWAGADGVPLPLGRTLEDLLLDASQRRALPRVRELLTAWQSGDAAAVPADRIVVDETGRCHGPAPSGLGFSAPSVGAGAGGSTAPEGRGFSAPSVGAGAGGSTAGEPLRALRAFAAIVIAGGYAHLWPAPADEAELTALLAGMTGRELEPAQVPAADPRPGVPDVRELLIARERLERELAEARAKHEFYERTIAGRDAELKRVRRRNALLSATVPGRAAATVVGGLRAGKRAMRAVVRRTRG